MDVTVCGTTAYQYWRTPPIVRLLAVATEADDLLSKYVSEAELTAFRADMVERLPFARACAVPRRTQGNDLRIVREACPLLAPSTDGPVELLAQVPEQRHITELTRYSLWQSPLPFGSVRQVASDLNVTSPSFTLLQLASRASLVRMVLLASEFCGDYAVYKAPQHVAGLLQRMAERDRLPVVDGWRPCLGPGKKVGDLWSRPSLVSPGELEDILSDAEFRRGRKTMTDALALLKPHAASPFETQAGVLLGFSRRRGGEGYGDFTFNEKIELSSSAKLLAQRGHCVCDLYWGDGLDVECQSTMFHEDGVSFLSDSDRTAALRVEGIDVLPLTYAQMRDPDRFKAFSYAAARALGRPWRDKTPVQKAATQRLREEVLVNWDELPFV